jgi:hypothetical protein
MAITVKDVNGLDLAFGRIDGLLPKWEDIPAEFKRSSNKWCRIVSQWFFSGLDGAEFKPKPGVNKSKALAHIQACLASWEPAHEHKEAGCAYLMSEFFEDVVVKPAKA